jgi:hypothetical protein
MATHSPVILDAIQGSGSTLSRHVRTEWRTWGKKLIDNNYVIGNWPGKEATKTIPIRSSKIGDLLADDFRAILLAILEEAEERRLYVRTRPEGTHLAHVLVLHALTYILTQGADWLVKRVDGECVLRSEYQPENNILLDSATPPAPMDLPVCTAPLLPLVWHF